MTYILQQGNKDIFSVNISYLLTQNRLVSYEYKVFLPFWKNLFKLQIELSGLSFSGFKKNIFDFSTTAGQEKLGARSYGAPAVHQSSIKENEMTCT